MSMYMLYLPNLCLKGPQTVQTLVKLLADGSSVIPGADYPIIGDSLCDDWLLEPDIMDTGLF
jgi:hypothetical protein